MADMAGFCNVCGKEFQNMALHNKTKKHLDKVAKGAVIIKEPENPVTQIIETIIPPEPKTEPKIPIVPPDDEDNEVYFVQNPDSGSGILWVLMLPFLALAAFAAFLFMKGDNNE